MVLDGCEKIIVVCPKNAIHRVWWNDINGMFKKMPKLWNSTMNNAPDKDTFLYVYHYEALDLVLQHHGNQFNQYKYGLILDESHNFNDVKSQRTLKWIDICKQSNSRSIIHMSGTPLKALGLEAIPLFRVIDPSFTPEVEERFKKIYGSSAGKGLDIIKNRLGIVSFTILKEELGLSKPEMVTVNVKTPNGNQFTLTEVRKKMQAFIEERVKYYSARADEDVAFYKSCLALHEEKIKHDKKLMGEFTRYKESIKLIQQNQNSLSLVKAEISFCKQYELKVISYTIPKEHVKAFRDVCSVIKYLTLKIQGECLGQVVGRMRIDAHIDMCQHIPFRDIVHSTKKKTVVFTSFVDVLETAKDVCLKQQLNPIVVYGKTNNHLTKLIQSFEQDEEVNPLIATYDSLSTAVPLVMADTMIMINAPFRAYIQEQAIARIHRLRQDSQTKIYQCVLDTGNEPNISSRSLDIMEWSQQQVEALTGVKSPYQIEETATSMTISAESIDEGLSTVISIDKDEVNINCVIKSELSRW